MSREPIEGIGGGQPLFEVERTPRVPALLREGGHHPVLVAVMLLALLLAVSCGDGDAPVGRTPTPSATFPPITPIGEGSITPTPPPPETPYRLVYRQFGETEDIIWQVNPADPEDRIELARIGHREGFGIVASLSPDGRQLAYLLQPESAPADPGLSRAVAYVLDLKTGRSEQIAEGVDLRFRPLWSPDGRLLYLRSLRGPDPLAADVVILQVGVPEPIEGTPTPSPTPSPTPTVPPGGTPIPTPVPDEPVKEILKAKVSQVLSFVPIGFSGDGALYFVQIEGGTGGGTVVGAYALGTTESIATATAEAELTATALAGASPTPSPAGATPTPAARFVVKLSDQIATDYHISPDQTRLSFIAQALVGGQPVFQAFVADLVSREVIQLPSAGLPPGDRLSPRWHPDGERLAVALLPRDGEPGVVAVVPLAGGEVRFLPPPTDGFDQPLAWSPDGVFLAVASFTGDSLANPGTVRLDVVAVTGQRITLSDRPDDATPASVLGWYEPLLFGEDE